MKLKYRPEIDGLRTVAVISVIVYHAEFAKGAGFLLEGGFFGVDIFFVISGFLITTLIINEHRVTGHFSIKKFYERRARRILPALLFVMVVSLPFAWLWLLPDQLVDFSKSQLASLLFGSNVYWLKSLQEYGAESALLKPFLHTWSLAVEEQFYIIFPIVFISVYRWRKSHYTMLLLISGFLLSLMFAEWITPRNVSFSFYMLPSRFWELIAGGLLANNLILHPQKDKDTLCNRTVPIIGLILIMSSIFFAEPGLRHLHHPGFITLMPVVGTVLIIWFTNGKDFVSKVLAKRLFVGIGLISYSLYLWHYPIFAFGRIIDSQPSTYHKLGWIFLTFVLSIATYLLIEQPFRNRKTISLETLTISIFLFVTTVGGISFYWIKNNGFESRLGYLNTIIKPSKRVWVTLDGEKCQSGGRGRTPEFDVEDSCVFNYNPGQKYLISIGDSHAASLSENIRILAEKNGLNFIQITNAGCPHILGYGTPHCQERAEQVLSYLEKFPNSTIIYSARIPLYMEQSRFDNEEGDREGDYELVDNEEVIADYPERSDMLVETLRGWVDAGHTLVIVYPVPEQGFSVDSKLFMIRPIIQSEDQLPDLSTSLSVFKKRTKSSYDALDRVTGETVFRVYPEKLFCESDIGRCFASKGSKIFFWSDNHVSPLGSSLIVEEIARLLELKIPVWGY